MQEPASSSGKTPAVTPFVSDLTHTALGQPKSWLWRTGDSASRSFDTDGRMTQSEIASYSYDAAGRITGVTQRLWAQRTVTAAVGGKSQTVPELYQTPISWTIAYDARNRLTSFTRAGASSAYSYDANSNRLTAIEQSTSEADLEGAVDQPNFTQSASQSLAIDSASNKLLGFAQTLTRTRAGGTVSSVVTQVNYSLDANGAMTSDGLRTFEYDESRRLAKVKVIKDGEAAAVEYLHNALGQRVFKSEPQAEQTLPNEEDLGPGFVNWLRKQFGWLFTQGSGSKSSIGMAFVYDEDANLLGEYDNGSALGKGRTEYIWLPTEDGQAIPIGLYKNGNFYAVHSDHLGTPRLITDTNNKPVWQWPYSAFGNNKTTGAVAATSPANGQTALKVSKPAIEVNLRFPGQYFDEESNLSYNYLRTYQASQGRYTQPDPIGLGGGLSRFSYARGNPLIASDPMGLADQTDGTRPSSRIIPNISDEAKGDLARRLQKWWDECRCEALEAEINRVAAELRERYFALLEDHRDLYGTAYLKRLSRRGGSYVGHQQQFRDKQKELRELISTADSRGCYVAPWDRTLANMGEPPDRPAAR